MYVPESDTYITPELIRKVAEAYQLRQGESEAMQVGRKLAAMNGPKRKRSRRPLVEAMQLGA